MISKEKKRTKVINKDMTRILIFEMQAEQNDKQPVPGAAKRLSKQGTATETVLGGDSEGTRHAHT